MARKMLVCLGIIVFALSVASTGFAARGSAMKGTVSKIEGNQVTVTLDSKDQPTFKEGDQVSVSAAKAGKAKSKKTDGKKSGAAGGTGAGGAGNGGSTPPAGK